MTAPRIHVFGGGPAGSSAALAALAEGAEVELFEKAKFPRHKVCGEFLSPEIQPALEQLGAWDEFCRQQPPQIRRMVLHFDRGGKTIRRQARLPEPAWGLSRYKFDEMLLELCARRGAHIRTPEQALPTASGTASIIAHGRQVAETKRGDRLFGFKAHFEGPVDDAVELFFYQGCYVGLNTVENKKTNICGIASEGFLRSFAFHYDAVIEQSPALRGRIASLSRCTPWVSTGPLEFRQRFKWNRERSSVFSPEDRWFAQAGTPEPASYPAGDALSFVDPFTGSGLLCAVKTGTLAGQAAARSVPVAEYLEACSSSLRSPFLAATVLRELVTRGWAANLAGWIPEQALFRLFLWTRPR